MFDLFFSSSRNRGSTSESMHTPSDEYRPPPSYQSTVQTQGACDSDEKNLLGDQGIRACLFYRVYNEDGGIKPRTAVDSNPYLGRIDPNRITPPHTVESIKRCICRLEHIEDYKAVDLYSSGSRATPMKDTEHVAILSGTGPGSTSNRPMALVRKCESSDASKTKSKSWIELFRPNRTTPSHGPGRTTTSTTKAPVSTVLQDDESSADFKIKIKTKMTWVYVETYPEWLPFVKGEVLHTDGVIHQATYSPGSEYTVYRARNAAGQVGLVVTSLVDHDAT